MRIANTICRDVNYASDPALTSVELLYHSVLDRDERIPWEWIVRGLGRPATRDARWLPRLVVAEAQSGAGRAAVTGFYYGAYLPAFGGYGCYLGVAPHARGRGVGRLLFQRMFGTFRRDARRLGEPLPFVLWESHKPRADEPAAVRANWLARLRLFDRVGGLRVDGVDFRVPNYMAPAADPVRLELFLRPFDEPAAALGDARLRAVVADLYRRVYHVLPGEALYEQGLSPARRLSLRRIDASALSA